MPADPSSRQAADDGFEADRTRILEAFLEIAPFDGWTPVSLRRAADVAGADRSTLRAAFPRGVADMLDFWSGRLDAEMAARLTGADFQRLKIREKVTAAIRARLEILAPHKEAARRAAATLALPVYAGLGARLAWRTADAVWRGIGDKSTDFNFYSKRAILTGVWLSTFARWLADDSAGAAKTHDFLDRRIANVMEFEKLKAKARDNGFDPEGMFGWLARVRYPASASKRRQEEKIDEALKESFPASDPPYWSSGNA